MTSDKRAPIVTPTLKGESSRREPLGRSPASVVPQDRLCLKATPDRHTYTNREWMLRVVLTLWATDLPAVVGTALQLGVVGLAPAVRRHDSTVLRYLGER